IPTPPSALTHTASNYSYPLSLPDALPILWTTHFPLPAMSVGTAPNGLYDRASHNGDVQHRNQIMTQLTKTGCQRRRERLWQTVGDRKSTRLNSSHVKISYAVFCLKKKIAK